MNIRTLSYSPQDAQYVIYWWSEEGDIEYDGKGNGKGRCDAVIGGLMKRSMV